MGFHKVGDADLASVRCSCGGEIVDGKCKSCGKEYKPEDLKERKEASDESKDRTDE